MRVLSAVFPNSGVLSQVKNMHIPTPKKELLCDSETRSQLEQFIIQAEPADDPPCTGCKQHVPKDCSGSCSRAAEALSIEPERYPIESKVVPLVFEITSTRLLQTCWSCEGHMDHENKLWKVPQVSFYSDSPIFPKLVLIHLTRLYQSKTLGYRWHVVLSDFTQSLGLTYSIQPDLNQEDAPRLGLLQQDMQTIADGMHTKLKSIASELIQTHCQ